nr:MAG TPA: hypothetical protein [Caudoviricetes sp.]
MSINASLSFSPRASPSATPTAAWAAAGYRDRATALSGFCAPHPATGKDARSLPSNGHTPRPCRRAPARLMHPDCGR